MFGRRFLTTRYRYKWAYQSLIHALIELTNKSKWIYNAINNSFELLNGWEYDSEQHAIIYRK